jgi:phosphoribosylformimino-5-aminoimidazole carboxamide ribotide isomerase
MIHIVDLDGAFTGEPKNLPALKKIVQAVDVPVQFGGGLRTSAVIREVLDAGVSRVILGTKAVEDTDFLAEVLSEFPGKVLVSVDTKKGVVLTQGWQTESGQKVEAAAFGLRLKSCGVSEVVFTDTAKDGTLRGPNIEALTDFALKTQLRVIASAGSPASTISKPLKRYRISV